MSALAERSMIDNLRRGTALENRAADEIERLRAERDQWNADARRLSGGLLAIRNAPEDAPSEVLRGVAYDIAMNCLDPDTAAFQIERRAALNNQQLAGKK